MKAAKFDYVRAASLQQAIGELNDGDKTVKPMSGSQSFGPMLNLRLARPAKVVDISGIDELRGVAESGKTIRIGAAVTHAEIEDGMFAPLRGHLMQEVAGRIAYRGVRNRGTVGGSLAHADPAADWVVVASGLGATLEITGPQGKREATMPEFMQGAYTVDLGPQDLITAVIVPARTDATRWGYWKFCRKTGEFAEASCAAYFEPSTRTARIAVGALDGAPALLDAFAADVAARGWDAADTQALHKQVESIARQASEAKKQLLATAIERCLEQVLGARNV